MIFVKKWRLEYQKLIKTYLPTYLWDGSDISDSCDSSDSIVSSVRNDHSDPKKNFTKQLFVTIFFLMLPRNFLFTKKELKTLMVIKLQLWKTQKTKIVVKLKKLNYDKTKN